MDHQDLKVRPIHPKRGFCQISSQGFRTGGLVIPFEKWEDKTKNVGSPQPKKMGPEGGAGNQNFGISNFFMKRTLVHYWFYATF